jgi:L-fuconolactonase
MTGVVDAHHHLWDLQRRDYPWMVGEAAPLRRSFGMDDLLPELHAHGVVQTVVVQATGSVEETEELLQVAAHSDVVSGVVGWVDLQAPNVADQLAQLRKRPGGAHLVGIRHQVHDEPDPAWILRAPVLRGLAAVADAGLTFDLLVRERELPSGRLAVAALPQLRVVLDHVAKPPIATGRWQPWAGQIAALAELANVSCKLSGLVTEADWRRWRREQLEPYVTWAVERFGPSRLLFGSDWPVCTLAASYGRVIETLEWLLEDLGAEAREAVFAGNARRVYRLPAPATIAG